MGQWNVSLRLLVMSELRRRYPNRSEKELRLLLAERLFGPEIAAQLSKGFLESERRP